ncbi:MAG: retropepsin-like aspartic protease [Pseudomonadales bacterium]
MKTISKNLLWVTVGIAVGWLANQFFSTVGKPPLPGDRDLQPIVTTEQPTWRDDQSLNPSSVTLAATQRPASNAFSDNKFRALLAEQAFEKAIVFYSQVKSDNDHRAASLKQIILSYLQMSLVPEKEAPFIALVDAYLSQYYDDIDILIILAEHHRREDYPSEAVRTLQMALTYAHGPVDQQKILQALQALINNTDQQLTEQQQWIKLLNFYELLNSIALAQPPQQLRQALLYQQLGDIESAKDILQPLIQDTQWGDKAQTLLANLSPVAKKEIASRKGIPLIRRGNHFLIKATLNDVDEVTLLLDTGASVTSLAQTSFNQLSRQRDFEEIGIHLFNTANGVTRGTIYRSSAFSLGENTLQNIDIAVLDFQMADGIDGLLGMNVLRNFRFDIDQDKRLLYLQPR